MNGTDTQHNHPPVFLVMICLTLGAFMSTLNTSIVSVSLPSITNDLQVSPDLTAWILVVYLLFSSSFLMTMGSLGDTLGHRRVFLAGFLIFTLSSFLSGLVHNIWTLLVLQALQGLGGGIVLALGPALISTVLPENMRGRAFGLIGASVSVALITGPILGGFLVELFSWHTIFFVNVPIGIAAIILVHRYIPGHCPVKTGGFDYKAALLLVPALAGLLYILSTWGKGGRELPYLPFILAGALVFAVLFIWHESRTSEPMVPLRLFGSLPFTASVLASSLIMATYGGLLVVFPYFFELIWKFSPEQAGYMVVAASAGLMIASILAGRSVDRSGATKTIITATCLAIGGSLVFLILGLNTFVLAAILGLFLFGAGTGAFYPPNISLVMKCARPGDEGAMSGIITTMRVLGQAVGVTLYGTVFGLFAITQSASREFPGAGSPSPTVLFPGFTAVFVLTVILLTATLVLVIVAKEPTAGSSGSG